LVQIAQRRVAIDPGEPPAFADHLARHHDEFDRVGLTPLDDGVEDRGFRVEIGVGDLVPIYQDEIGGLADREASDPAAEGSRHRPAGGGHAQHLAGARWGRGTLTKAQCWVCSAVD
jgi:hypothetical protein